jgi:hypothetical protein
MNHDIVQSSNVDLKNISDELVVIQNNYPEMYPRKMCPCDPKLAMPQSIMLTM